MKCSKCDEIRNELLNIESYYRNLCRGIDAYEVLEEITNLLKLLEKPIDKES